MGRKKPGRKKAPASGDAVEPGSPVQDDSHGDDTPGGANSSSFSNGGYLGQPEEHDVRMFSYRCALHPAGPLLCQVASLIARMQAHGSASSASTDWQVIERDNAQTAVQEAPPTAGMPFGESGGANGFFSGFFGTPHGESF